MSDLSWLNPTPHAIAVYASQPLSPAATQHSLPGGRYSLLGPDLHRLDRTSLQLAHLLDHLVGSDKQRRWDGQAERLGGFEVDRKLELGRPLNWKIAWVRAPEDAIHIACRPGVLIRAIDAIGDQAAGRNDGAKCIDRGHAILGCERDDQREMGHSEAGRRNDQTRVRLSPKGRNSIFQFANVVHGHIAHFDAERWAGRSDRMDHAGHVG